MNSDDMALQKILGDMDGMDGDDLKKRRGMAVTITITPGEGDGNPEQSGINEENDYPEGHDISLCKGGCAYHKGGMVE